VENAQMKKPIFDLEIMDEPAADVWRCPCCDGLNVWAWTAAELASKKHKIPLNDFKTASGSCFDNICGHCGADLVKEDSPILAQCFTHNGD
jgi:hypothetical protein